MDLEKQLLSEYGNKRPFKVSDGYFDKLSERIMEHISIDAGNVEQTHKKNIKLIRRLKPLLMAASIIGFVFLAVLTYRVFLGNTSLFSDVNETSFEKETSTNEKLTAEDIDEAVDYMMIDEEDMYACLSDN